MKNMKDGVGGVRGEACLDFFAHVWWEEIRTVGTSLRFPPISSEREERGRQTKNSSRGSGQLRAESKNFGGLMGGGEKHDYVEWREQKRLRKGWKIALIEGRASDGTAETTSLEKCFKLTDLKELVLGGEIWWELPVSHPFSHFSSFSLSLCNSVNNCKSLRFPPLATMEWINDPWAHKIFLSQRQGRRGSGEEGGMRYCSGLWTRCLVLNVDLKLEKNKYVL